MDSRVVVATAKVQIFKQITTFAPMKVFQIQLLLLPQRYKFSSKSQHCCHYSPIECSCCCYRKGTNFQANHNRKRRARSCNTVVVATAKVQIFKQITTHLLFYITFYLLLLLPQRYKFSSKSQPQSPIGQMRKSCCCYRKGTNFQANHNKSRSLPDGVLVVVATAKVQIFKQITTQDNNILLNNSCCCYRKGTNFQANHNWFSSRPRRLRVVVATAKVQIFKQITTIQTKQWNLLLLLLLPQRYKFSSKSQQQQEGRCRSFVVVATAKVQIFKQITTLLHSRVAASSCCCYRKGTNFQANHNHHMMPTPSRPVVVATAKVQIFKQITTVCVPLDFAAELLLLPQRYKFSSKSQRFLQEKAQIFCCCCYRKGTNFQANHNKTCGTYLWSKVVVATAKVQIFKQITTGLVRVLVGCELLLLPQRYKFSSKSQLYKRNNGISYCCCCYRKGTNFQANHNRLLNIW